MVLTFFSPISNEIEHLLIYLLVFHVSSLLKCLFKYITHLLVFFLYYWVLRVLKIYFWYSSFIKYVTSRYFLPVYGLTFQLLSNVLILMNFNLSKFDFTDGACVIVLKKNCLMLDFSPNFLPEVYFWVIFAYDTTYRLHFI